MEAEIQQVSKIKKEMKKKHLVQCKRKTNCRTKILLFIHEYIK